jgi:hypothetical protein
MNGGVEVASTNACDVGSRTIGECVMVWDMWIPSFVVLVGQAAAGGGTAERARTAR